MELVFRGQTAGADTVQIYDIADRESFLIVNCSGSDLSGSQLIPNSFYKNTVVCKYADASNFCAQLSSDAPLGTEVEIYAEGGNVTVYPGYDPVGSATFLDGDSFVTFSSGAKFKRLLSSNGNSKWACIG